MQTAERSSGAELSDNFIFKRHQLAYEEAAKLISGKVIELGSGMGHGTALLVPYSQEYIAIDKYAFESEELSQKYNFKFIQMNMPPLRGIPDSSCDFVVTFQVIEHIEDDVTFLKEIARILKPGGKLILTTPNIKMSLTRNPWHVREYNTAEMNEILTPFFSKITIKGVFGNQKITDYYLKNKASVEKITRFDIFDLQHRLPRTLLQVPYDIMNRINRKKLLSQNQNLVKDIISTDYFLADVNDSCYDFFCICEK
jgi:SAM-dependent methyltransferase